MRRSLVGLATVFDSHAWQYPFSALVSALELFEATERAAGRHGKQKHWLDIFVVNQNPGSQVRRGDTDCFMEHSVLPAVGAGAGVEQRMGWEEGERQQHFEMTASPCPNP